MLLATEVWSFLATQVGLPVLLGWLGAVVTVHLFESSILETGRSRLTGGLLTRLGRGLVWIVVGGVAGLLGRIVSFLVAVPFVVPALEVHREGAYLLIGWVIPLGGAFLGGSLAVLVLLALTRFVRGPGRRPA